MSHALTRTSPKGYAFVGRCVKCGKENLRMSEALNPCPQDSIVSDEAALLELVQGPDDQGESSD